MGLFIETSFSRRMANLFRSDSTIAMAPGIGTYQEMGRFLRLWVTGKLSRGENHNKMIVYNQEQVNRNPLVRLMDIFIDGLLPEKYKKAMDMVFDTDQIKAHLTEQYEAKMGCKLVPLAERPPAPALNVSQMPYPA